MATFKVNGKEVSTAEEKRLLHFLRYDLKLTSVKDGCAEGSCGTCTVLIDGEAARACSWLTSEMEGREILTVEGLSDYEKNVYSYAFGKAGAVQCGFCIPGMVMCAKGLISRNPDPSEKEIRHAIRNNICRCTGYVKIVEAIKLSASIFRGENIMESDEAWKVGSRVRRVDVIDKVTGKAIYPDDIYAENQLNVVAVRSEYPRAKVLAVNIEDALKYPGIAAVITSKDIPGNKVVGHLKKDWDAMIGIGEITRYRGDVIALVVGENRACANKAKELVKVEYEELPFVSNAYEAMKDDAPLIHEDGNLLGHTYVNRGNVDEALCKADYVLSGKFTTPWAEHAFMEPECAIAYPLDDGKIKIYSADQGVYDTRRETAPMLGLDEDMVLVENCYVGGGFGGKEDVSVQHLAALAAMITKRPCKMKLTRDESILCHPKKHQMDMDFTIGCDKNGKLVAFDGKIITDNGAYASLGLPVLQRACTHASGPYNFRNFRIDGKAYYTNNPPAGAFRGFGVNQSCFAVETLLNLMADKIGISHWDIRYINAIRPGQELPNGQIVDNATALAETLEAVKDVFFSNKFAGIACAMKNAGVGVGIPDTGRVKLSVENGSVIIHCAGSCIGQGVCTVLKQIVCDVTGLSEDCVKEEKANTFNAPDSGTTSGSRHTTVSGEAARRAAEELKTALEEKGSLQALDGCDFYAEYLAKTDEFGSSVANPKSHIAYGYATQVCILDEETHKIKKIIAAHDVGKAINPTSTEGQIEGGVVMGMGYALRERYRLENCVPLEHFASLGLFRADEVPQIESILVEKEGLDIACGAKGIGEITCIPTAPAIADAYYRLDGQIRYSLPLKHTPYERFEDYSEAKGKSVIINKKARCIGCFECARACADTFYKTEKLEKACIKFTQKDGIGNQSGYKAKITRPVVCTQCGLCAKACPVGAISKNRFGVWVIDKKMCTGCGACRSACPFGIIVENSELNVSTKCIACGKCVQACSSGVLGLSVGDYR